MATWAERIGGKASNKDRRSTGDPDVINPSGSEVAQGETPRDELVPSPVFPYRGMETHGVEHQRVAELEDPTDLEWSDGKFEAPAEDIQPLPVRVVRESSDEYRAFRMAQFPVNSTVNRIVGRDRTRQKITVVHAGPVNEVMAIGHDQNLSATSGYLLYQGQSVSIETSEPVFALAPFSAGQLVAMTSQEYMVNPLGQNTGMAREAQVPRRRR